MSEEQRDYNNGEITIHWKAEKCIHSAVCVKGLPRVFNPKQRPWINTEQADTETLRAQVKKCPSGALSYSENS